MVLIPPLFVYNHIRSTENSTVNSNRTPMSSNKISCSTLATSNNRIDAPIILDNKKNDAPVL
jgi:hypothetical protein